MSWKDLGFNEHMEKEPENEPKFISGEEFNTRMEAQSFEKYPLRIFTERQPAPKKGMTYYDKDDKKFKIYVGDSGKWADVQYTTTSTSTSTSTTTTT